MMHILGKAHRQLMAIPISLQLTLSGNLSSDCRIDSLESGFAFTLATMDHRLGDPSAVGSMLQRDSYFQLVIGIASDATVY